MKCQIVKPSQNQRIKKNNPQYILANVCGYLPERYRLPGGYSSTPSPKQIFANNGICHGLVIQSHHGKVEWKGMIDLSNLRQSLAQTIRIDHRQIEVYIEDCGKPEQGKELNVGCSATFYDHAQIDAGALRQICKNNGTKLVNVRFKQAQFTVAIPHFTKFTFKDTEQPKQMRKNTAGNRSVANNITNPSIENSDLSIKNTLRPVNHRSNQILSKYSQRMNNSISQNNSYMDIEKRSNTPNKQQQNRIRQIKINMSGISDIRPLQTNPLIQLINRKAQQMNEEMKQDKDISLLSHNDESNILQVQNNYRESQGYSYLEPDQLERSYLTHTMVAKGIINKPQGNKVAFNSVNLQKQVHTVSFYQLNIQNYRFDPHAIAKMVTDESFPFFIRRLLSLYSVLFHDKVYFEIGRTNTQDYDIWFEKQPRKNSDNFREERFKCWLAWIIGKEYDSRFGKQMGLLRYNTKLMTALALRRPQTVINYLYINNRFDEAEFVINIQDNAYRETFNRLFNDKLQHFAAQLKEIFKERVEENSFSEWLPYFAICVWYFKKQDFMSNVRSAIQHINFNQAKNYIQQFRIIQIFLAKCKNRTSCQLLTYNPRFISTENICFMYFTSTLLKLSEYQKAYFGQNAEQSQYMYERYRSRIVHKIIDLYKQENRDIVIKLINNDAFLTTKQMKQELYRRVYNEGIGKGMSECSETKEIEIQCEANRLKKEGNFLEAARRWFQIPHWNLDQSKEIFKLVTMPQLLANYSQSVNQQVYQLLAQRKEQFSDLLLILQIGQSKQLSCDQIYKLIDLMQGKSRFSVYFEKKIKGIMIYGLQRSLQVAIVLRNQFFKEMIQRPSLVKSIKTLMKSRFETLHKMDIVLSKI